MFLINRIIALSLLIPPVVLAVKSVHLLAMPQKHIVKKLLFFISCTLLVGMPIFFSDLANLLPTLILFVTAVLLCCEGRLLPKITIALLFAGMGFAISAVNDNFFSNEIIWTKLYRLLAWGLVYLLLHRYAPGRNYTLSKHLWRLLLLLAFIPLGLVMTVVLFSRQNILAVPGIRITYFLLFMLIIFFYLGLLQIISVLARQQQLEQQNTMMQLNQRYYKALEQQQFEVRRLKHDLVNHLQVINALPPADRDVYIARLTDAPAFNRTVEYCRDATINAVLNAKADPLEAAGITFAVTASLNSPLPFEKADICCIFANALDNAIEYCQTLPAPQRRISLHTYEQKGLFALKVANPYRGENQSAIDDESLIATTKNDKIKHGLGLKSIREAVLRYNGHMEIKTDNQEFLLFVYIPL